jgi:trans-2-enoyl-CoA reductase
MSQKIILPFIFIALLIGCSSPSMTASDLYSALDQNLSKKDQVILDSLQSHVQKFNQLNKELNMLLEEMKKEGELEAAVETMQIANEEAMYIFNLIELDGKPSNTSLDELRNHIQASIERYMESMNTLLQGITNGDTNKTDKGYEQIKSINEEFDQLLSHMEG